MIRFHAARLAFALLMAVSAPLLASDPPHKGGISNVQCLSCHKLHGAPGGTLTKVAGNTALCISCHNSSGDAKAKALATSDQAVPAGASMVGSTAGGTSHRWDSSAAGRVINGTSKIPTPDITPSGDYTGAYAATIKLRVAVAGGTGGTSPAQIAWSQTANGTATFGGETTITTSATPVALVNTGVSLAFSSTATFVLNDVFYLYVRPDLVNPTSIMSTRLEGGKIMCSTCHDQHLQALAPFDPNAAPYSPTANNRHFQRVANDTGSLCGDCHAARNVGKGGTSHPVHVNYAAAANMQATFPASLVKSAGGNVECLTCHDVHGASSATSPAGMLLRVSNSTALCTSCHTLADTTTANTHTNPTSGILWPGDGYGGSTYPAYTLAADRGACKNCHTPHGWPDANNPGGKYANALGAEQDNLCETCHDSNGPSNKDVRTQIIKTYNHPVDRNSGRTVGCADCHNPHMAVAGIHTIGGVNGNRIRSATGTPIYSNALRGVDGLTFNYAGLGNWATPPNVTGASNSWFSKFAGGSPATLASGAEFEYQVCFKCHTSYAFGSTPPVGMVAGALALASGSLQPWVAGIGTATFNSTNAVVGSGTSWNTPSIRYMYIRHVGYTGTLRYVSTVTDNTHITLSNSYSSTISNSAYELRASAVFSTTTTVTGGGTNWTNALVGQYIAPASSGTSGTSYRITAVGSTTSLTIASAATTINANDFYIHPAATFTNGSTTVTGVGTNWTNALVGATIQKSGDPAATFFTIASVQSPTSLTLSAAYTGTSAGFPTRYGFLSNKVETDVAQEFNPGNASFHPVVAGSASAGSGSSVLASGQMVAPWATNLGTQTMMCSDCHNTDAATPAAQGPHGSTVPFMLKGTNKGWPDVGTAGAWGTSFCTNCHASANAVGGVNIHTNTGSHNIPCYRCHIVVPHGGKLGRLIGDGDPTSAMPSRYAYNNDKTTMFIVGFTKTTGQYQKTNCGTNSSSCTGEHPSTNGATW